mgnify:FL=1
MTVRTSMSCLALAALAWSCTPAASGGSGSAPRPAATPASTTSAARNTGAWTPLFDGTSFTGWRGYKVDTVPSGWRVVDGTIAKTRPVEDIVTVKEYGDFELEIEWKIGRAGNSGIFYRGTEEYDHIYWTAPEYQLLDDSLASDNKTRLTCAGAAYGLYPSPAGHLKPVGEWNSTRIVARGNHVEHWLNGFKLLEYELNSPEWLGLVAKSKFNAWPNYGRNTKGHIALQGDHTGTLAFRNIRIREF